PPVSCPSPQLRSSDLNYPMCRPKAEANACIRRPLTFAAGLGRAEGLAPLYVVAPPLDFAREQVERSVAALLFGPDALFDLLHFIVAQPLLHDLGRGLHDLPAADAREAGVREHLDQGGEESLVFDFGEHL